MTESLEPLDPAILAEWTERLATTSERKTTLSVDSMRRLLADYNALTARVAEMDGGHCSGCGENVTVYCGWCSE